MHVCTGTGVSEQWGKKSKMRVAYIFFYRMLLSVRLWFVESWFDILNVIRDHVVLLDVAFQEDDINLRVFHAMDQDWDQPIGENKTSVTVEVNSLNGFLLCFLTDCRLRKNWSFKLLLHFHGNQIPSMESMRIATKDKWRWTISC